MIARFSGDLTVANIRLATRRIFWTFSNLENLNIRRKRSMPVLVSLSCDSIHTTKFTYSMHSKVQSMAKSLER